MRIFYKHGWQHDTADRMVRWAMRPLSAWGMADGKWPMAKLVRESPAVLRRAAVLEECGSRGGHGHSSGRCSGWNRPCYLKKAVQWMRKHQALMRKRPKYAY